MKELGASLLAITNQVGIGVRHLCKRHGYLRLGSGYILVQAGEEWWYACASCLMEEVQGKFIVIGAVDDQQEEQSLPDLPAPEAG